MKRPWVAARVVQFSRLKEEGILVEDRKTVWRPEGIADKARQRD